MRRRAALRTILVGVVGTTAGCNGLFTGESSDVDASAPEATAAPDAATASDADTDATASATGATAETPTPYRVADAPPLDGARGIHVRNLASLERFLTVVVSDGDAELFADSATVAAGDTVAFPSLVASAGTYDVLVETADGVRRRYEWTVRPAFDDLWVDLTPAITFHRPVLCAGDCAFVDPEADRTLAYEVPSDVDVAAALGRTPALAVDNDTGRETRTRVHVWNQGSLRFAATIRLPADVRALVPVFPATRRYDVVVRTAAGEAIYDWQPSVRNTLYASLADGPTFRCGYAAHDLLVTNEYDEARTVTVRVGTSAETLFERSFALGPNATETVRAAVEPAGPFRFEVTTDDGFAERYNWVRCAPNGPIVVVVGDGAASVSVRPTGA